MKTNGRIWPKILKINLCLTLAAVLFVGLYAPKTQAVVNPQSGSIGLQGTIPSPPPTVAASITTPSNGQVFSKEPVTVQGICPSNLLIKLFINGIFSGSAECVNNSYSITATLFNGTNVLIVRDYDALDQSGPDSNSVTVSFNSGAPGASSSITLTSNYSELGADPGSVLSWPIIISGGLPPYALSIDWGDGSTPELVSQTSAGTFDITHTYSIAGVYTIFVRATDTANNLADLQLVGISNGVVSKPKSSTTTTPPSTAKTVINRITSSEVVTLSVVVIILTPIAFWLGSRHTRIELQKKIKSGDRPFDD